jgi:putative transposase
LTSIGRISMNGEKPLTDERISGTDDFVEGVLGIADRTLRRSFASWVREIHVKRFIEEKREKEGISVQELQLGAIAGRSRRFARNLTLNLARERGTSFSGNCEAVGVSTSAISQILWMRQET